MGDPVMPYEFEVTPRDLTLVKEKLTYQEWIELYTEDEEENGKIRGDRVVTKYVGDPIEAADFLIPVNGVYDSHNNRAIEKKISWNKYEEWKSTGVTGELRFPRGVAGVFGEYENLWQTPAVSGGTSTTVGDWEKLESSGASNCFLQEYAIAQDKTYVSFKTKKGSEDAIEFRITTFGTLYIMDFNFSTGIVAGGAGLEIDVIEIVQNQEYEIRYIADGTASGGSDNILLYAHNSGSGGAGKYTYYKDISYIGGIDYPVPYVKGTHEADKWQHPVNWSESDEWTIDIWEKASDITDLTVFDSRDDDYLDDGILLYKSAGNYTIFSVLNGSQDSLVLSTQPTEGQYNHFKVVYTSGANIKVYLNKELVATKTTNIPFVVNMPSIINIGHRNNKILQLNGYFADIMIRPTADTTKNHYHSGLPWTNPENIAEGEHGAYIDKYGNYAGESFTGLSEDTYSIVEQYTIEDSSGSQTVTKWSNGDMEILHKKYIINISSTILAGSIFVSNNQVPSEYIEDFIANSREEINVKSSVLGSSGAAKWGIQFRNELTRPSTYQVASPISTTGDAYYYAVSKGKWK